MSGGVFIAMPVYRGTEVIEETLRSILAQTWRQFHLVMSVDGSDDPTIEVCRKYEDDPRIDVVIQEERLGWPGNFNWLVERCDEEYFCYWQQDDLASTGYLESLRLEMLARPDAAIAFTDVQWFGARFDRTWTHSIEGDPLARVMQHIEAVRYEPLRGLMRSSFLPPGGKAIPVTEDESHQEEFVFLTHMAAAGAFLRVDSAMYFKRLHDTNVFMKWTNLPDWRRRREWISMGAGMHQIAVGQAEPNDRPLVLAQILDRLAVVRHGRGFFYTPPQASGEIGRFVRDFVARAEIESDDLRCSGSRPNGLQRVVHEDVLAALEVERSRARQRAGLETEMKRQGVLRLNAEEASDGGLLGYGWSELEPWGIWTDGGTATLVIPAPSKSEWRAVLSGRLLSSTEPITMGYQIGNSPLREVRLSGDRAEITVQSGGEGNVIHLHLPDARSPMELSLSDDHRLLGFGLVELSVHLES